MPRPIPPSLTLPGYIAWLAPLVRFLASALKYQQEAAAYMDEIETNRDEWRRSAEYRQEIIERLERELEVARRPLPVLVPTASVVVMPPPTNQPHYDRPCITIAFIVPLGESGLLSVDLIRSVYLALQGWALSTLGFYLILNIRIGFTSLDLASINLNVGVALKRIAAELTIPPSDGNIFCGIIRGLGGFAGAYAPDGLSPRVAALGDVAFEAIALYPSPNAADRILAGGNWSPLQRTQNAQIGAVLHEITHLTGTDHRDDADGEPCICNSWWLFPEAGLHTEEKERFRQWLLD